MRAEAPGGRVLGRGFYRRPSLEVAPELLGKVMLCGERAGRIVEVEAYGGADDPASHAFAGPTRRNRIMFGPAGHLYVYRIYGLHWCSNAVTGEAGRGEAVLIRALAPLRGRDAMRASRPKARRERDLCSGPAKLCQALGLTGEHDGLDLVAGGAITLLDDGTPPPADPGRSPRIGISKAAARPWRFYCRGEANVSVPPRL